MSVVCTITLPHEKKKTITSILLIYSSNENIVLKTYTTYIYIFYDYTVGNKRIRI